MRTRVLFVCTGNAVQSQMAEALLRAIGADRFEVASAGTRPAECVHPLTMRVLERAGIKTLGSRPKSIEGFRRERFDVLITLSDEARARCMDGPTVLAGETMHWHALEPQGGTATELDFVEAMKQMRRRVELLATVAPKRNRSEGGG
jgi:protein-tyrosine-phosphatase